MYAGLTAEERDALAEVTRMGFPPRAWFDAERISLQYTTVWAGLFDHMVRWDPTYFDDFWTVPGYLGANPTESLARSARLQHKTKVGELIMAARGRRARAADADRDGGPAHRRRAGGLPCSTTSPTADLTGAMLRFTSGGAAGHNVWISGVRNGYVRPASARCSFDSLRGVAVGDEVLIDNTAYLAFQTYHRHQVPTDDYPEWDQFRAAGRPIYPQRPELLGPRYARNGGAGLQGGRFDGKMIVVQCLSTRSPIRSRRTGTGGGSKRCSARRLDDQLPALVRRPCDAQRAARPAGRDDVPARTTRIVNYRGVLEQALRDVAAWVENAARRRPPSTNYELVDGQIVVPPSAADRRGIQPVVTLTANGGARAEVAVGDVVEFSALVDVPPGAGTIVGAEWDFEGAGDFPVVAPFDNEASSYASKTLTTVATRSPRPAPTSPPYASPRIAEARWTTRTVASRTSAGSEWWWRTRKRPRGARRQSRSPSHRSYCAGVRPPAQ